MTKKSGFRWALPAAFAAGCVASGIALAQVAEVEPNNSVTTPQRLVVGPNGSVSVNGVIGVLSGQPVLDVDFYSFQGKAGDVVTIDIDNALSADNQVGVDTTLYVFGPAPVPANQLPLRMNDDAGFPIDPGSASGFDARIDNFRLDKDGTYIVAVTGYPIALVDATTIVNAPLGTTSNGSYTLIISGVTPSVQTINIDIKPGSTEVAPINPKAKGTIPVALLSNPQFNALQVDQKSLRFGATGSEASLVRCNAGGADVNADGLPDLICHFDNQAANFSIGSAEGVVTGSGPSGAFEGRAFLKVVPGKKR